MIARRVLFASAAAATTVFMGGCVASQGPKAPASGKTLRCVREFGPAGKVPPIFVKCSR